MKLTLPNGKTVDAKSIDFEANKEEWNIYKLEDGTILKVKTILTSVIRADVHDLVTGDPLYQIQSKLITSTLVPEKLKKAITIKKDVFIDVA